MSNQEEMIVRIAPFINISGNKIQQVEINGMDVSKHVVDFQINTAIDEMTSITIKFKLVQIETGPMKNYLIDNKYSIKRIIENPLIKHEESYAEIMCECGRGVSVYDTVVQCECGRIYRIVSEVQELKGEG